MDVSSVSNLLKPYQFMKIAKKNMEKLKKLLSLPRRIYLRKFLLGILIISALIIFFIKFFELALRSGAFSILYGNITCHYADSQDSLPSVDVGFTPPENSIYFHETSCRGDLDIRQACAVESAARTHPNWQIFVLFAGPVTNFTLKYGNVAHVVYANVNIARIHPTMYAKGTPLEENIVSGALYNSAWRVSHTSDVLRYLTLYKFGGIYLDLDVIVTKSLEDLGRNWGGSEDNSSVSAGALRLSRDKVGRRFATAAVVDLKEQYNGYDWSNNGPGVITRVVQQICPGERLDGAAITKCQGFKIYGPRYFYPISWRDGKKYFRTGKLTVTDSYIYHIWGHKTSKLNVMKHSPYAQLAREYCPTIYERFKSKFGS